MPESDQTVWSGLLKGAQNGKLKLLNVDLAEFKKLITACESFVADIIGLSTATGQNFPPTIWTHDNSGEKLEKGGNPTKTVTTLESMRLLFERYEKKRLTELVEALKDHQTLITTMADTFSRAHSSYKNTDDANATTFNTPATGTDHWPRIWKEHSVPNSNWSNGPGEPTTAGSGAPFDPNVKKDLEGFIEHGYQFGLYDFANVRLIIEKNAGNVPWIAGEWRAFADIWRHSVLNFKTAVSPAFTAGHWQGEGAEQAVAFLTKYLDTAKSLENSMVSMSNVIGNTANFMSYVHNNLPFYSEIEVDDNQVPTKVGTHNASSHITVIRDFWDTGYDGTGRLGYRDGISQIMGWVPTFADPITLTAAPPVTPDNSGGGTGGNDNNKNNKDGDKQPGGGGDKQPETGGGGANPNDKKAGGGTGGDSGSPKTGGEGAGGNKGATGGAGGTNPGGSNGTGGTGGATGGGGMSSSDMLSLFSEVLQLVSSGITALVQLGNQLAAQLGPGLQALAKAVENGSMTVKQALTEASERLERQVDEVEEKLFPPGATGPVDVSFALFPGGGPELRIDFPGRAGSAEPQVFQDFTMARSTTEVPGVPVATEQAGETVEENR
ncbi:hypothetical protein [Nocardia arizonensis]|uniref:hypothetical protein n=1 Tax=Nocardia arizonensis TaxID=1141647 RepID=UPI0006D0EE7F|nr:hypothetical protein [Nocardia arizonensis]